MPKSIEALLEVASDLELMVYTWLVQHHIMFDFQSQLVGGYGKSLGDTVCDFVIPELRLVFRVQGEYWHTHTEEMARDIIARAALEYLGYTVVDLWEDDIREDLDNVMTMAMNGEEIPH